MKKSTYIGVGLFILIVVSGIAFINFNGDKELRVIQNNNENALVKNEEVREIVIDAKRFDFSPGNIDVKQGERIRLKINNLDTLHGISIPGLDVSGNDVVEFTASERGTYPFYCSNYCGGGHREMRGMINVN